MCLYILLSVGLSYTHDMQFKPVLILSVVGVLINAARSSLIDSFEDWVRNFAIKFKNDFHFGEVYEIWKSNHKFIEEINSKNLSYVLGHNQFSGMTLAEYKEYLGYSGLLEYNPPKSVSGEYLSALPEYVNWVEKNAVTPVKNQGQCGSCWSFSTTGALEGAYSIQFGKLVSFSEQQLVDCDTQRNKGKDHGCNGGLMDNAFEWIRTNGGLCTEADYPYVSGTTKKGGECQTTCKDVENSAVSHYTDVEPSSEDAMMSAIARQPVSIAIEADQREFQLYKSGVFTGECGTKLDHGVLVVGYGKQNGEDYYLVKNSWGEEWGSKGYILLGRGKKYNNGDGQCGMLLSGSYPVI